MAQHPMEFFFVDAPLQSKMLWVHVGLISRTWIWSKQREKWDSCMLKFRSIWSNGRMFDPPWIVSSLFISVNRTQSMDNPSQRVFIGSKSSYIRMFLSCCVVFGGKSLFNKIERLFTGWHTWRCSSLLVLPSQVSRLESSVSLFSSTESLVNTKSPFESILIFTL